MNAVPIADFHIQIICDTFDAGLTEADSLLLFAVLHSYQIEVAGPVMRDRPAVGAGTLVPAITQRHCSEAVAALWAGDPRCGHYTFWYHCWQEWGSYSRFEQLTPAERARMRTLIAELERHPFVTRLVPEEFDPAETSALEPKFH